MDAVLDSKRSLDDSVYSNFDHALDEAVAKRLETEPGTFAQHAAWNYCGYVWYDDGKWYEQVWRHGSPVETRSDGDLVELITGVVRDYGNE